MVPFGLTEEQFAARYRQVLEQASDATIDQSSPAGP
jgi:hypothetical protein